MKLAAYWSANKVPIVLGVCSLLCIVISIVLLVNASRPAAPIEFRMDAPKSNGEATESAEYTIVVDIEGAVNTPGVYRLSPTSRVQDVIDAAGGVTQDADAEAMAKLINRAAKVTDGAKLYIPHIRDRQNGGAPVMNTNVVSVNAASQMELEKLSGVGPATAQKIVDNRPYQTLEELVTKKSMGQALFEKIQDQLSL